MPVGDARRGNQIHHCTTCRFFSFLFFCSAPLTHSSKNRRARAAAPLHPFPGQPPHMSSSISVGRGRYAVSTRSDGSSDAATTSVGWDGDEIKSRSSAHRRRPYKRTTSVSASSATPSWDLTATGSGSATKSMEATTLTSQGLHFFVIFLILLGDFVVLFKS